jgi:hypothetical protein
MGRTNTRIPGLSLLTSPTLRLEDFSQTRYGETGAIRPRHYEVWFAPGAITLAQTKQ